MRDGYLMQPSVTRNPDELIKAIGRYRRRQLIKAALPLLIGVAVFALLIGFLMSDTAQEFYVWMDGAK